MSEELRAPWRSRTVISKLQISCNNRYTKGAKLVVKVVVPLFFGIACGRFRNEKLNGSLHIKLYIF